MIGGAGGPGDNNLSGIGGTNAQDPSSRTESKKFKQFTSGEFSTNGSASSTLFGRITSSFGQHDVTQESNPIENGSANRANLVAASVLRNSSVPVAAAAAEADPAATVAKGAILERTIALGKLEKIPGFQQMIDLINDPNLNDDSPSISRDDIINETLTITKNENQIKFSIETDSTNGNNTKLLLDYLENGVVPNIDIENFEYFLYQGNKLGLDQVLAKCHEFIEKFPFKEINVNQCPDNRPYEKYSYNSLQKRDGFVKRFEEFQKMTSAVLKFGSLETKNKYFNSLQHYLSNANDSEYNKDAKHYSYRGYFAIPVQKYLEVNSESDKRFNNILYESVRLRSITPPGNQMAFQNSKIINCNNLHNIILNMNRAFPDSVKFVDGKLEINIPNFESTIYSKEKEAWESAFKTHIDAICKMKETFSFNNFSIRLDGVNSDQAMVDYLSSKFPDLKKVGIYPKSSIKSEDVKKITVPSVWQKAIR